MTAVGYVGAPQDVANLVGFIASKEAHFITGQSVSYCVARKSIILIKFMFSRRFRVTEDGVLTNFVEYATMTMYIFLLLNLKRSPDIKL